MTLSFIKNHFKKIDWILFISIFLLVCIGLVSIYSSSLAENNFLNFKKQIVFFSAAIFLMFTLSFLDWRAIRDNSYFILIVYLFCILSLFGLFFLAPEIRGIKSWYKVGSFSFDPVEFTKLVLIIILAMYFSKRHIEMYRLSHILFSGAYPIVPSVLIFFQPNFGSAMVLIFLWAGILLVSGIKLKHFLILVFCGFISLVLIWSFLLEDYQKTRITSFLGQKIEPLGSSWNQTQAKIAVGSGGIMGKGVGKGSQVQYGFLPEPQTDFIFAAIAEELGFLGIISLLFFYAIFLWRIMRIIIFSQSNFSRLFATGFVLILFPQIFVHIGMNLGILPVIGLPLPLVSYGGSSLIATFIGLGILQSIRVH